jgi:hypothetical protein
MYRKDKLLPYFCKVMRCDTRTGPRNGDREGISVQRVDENKGQEIGVKREEVVGRWRTLHNQELHNLFFDISY